MCTPLLRCAAEYWRTTIEGSRCRFLDFSQDPNGPPATQTIHKTTTLLRRRDGRDQTEQPERGKRGGLGRLGLRARGLLGEEDERLARRRPDQS